MLKTRSGKEISKIGIGTWTIKKEDMAREVDALKFYYASGVNYIDVVLAYDEGQVIDVVAQFLKTVKREDIFINAFITWGCKEPDDIEKQIEFYLERLETDYLDCVTLHGLGVLGFDFEVYRKRINALKKEGKVSRIGYSNLMPSQLHSLIEGRGEIDFFEGLYNLENKINEDNGIMQECLKNGVEFYAYQPLRRNRTAKQNYPEVVALAKKYGVTQNQVIINWLIKHKKIGILIKSSSKDHIKENLESLNFNMTAKEYKSLDLFRNAEFDKIPVCYTSEEGKIRIDQIPNQPIGIL